VCVCMYVCVCGIHVCVGGVFVDARVCEGNKVSD